MLHNDRAGTEHCSVEDLDATPARVSIVRGSSNYQRLMGALFKFECPSCGYSAEVSGGADRGFFAATQTISCKDCKRLYDVGVARIDGPDSSLDSNRLRVPQCPQSELHRVKEWKGPGPCPACGSRMAKQEATILWD